MSDMIGEGIVDSFRHQNRFHFLVHFGRDVVQTTNLVDIFVLAEKQRYGAISNYNDNNNIIK